MPRPSSKKRDVPTSALEASVHPKRTRREEEHDSEDGIAEKSSERPSEYDREDEEVTSNKTRESSEANRGGVEEDEEDVLSGESKGMKRNVKEDPSRKSKKSSEAKSKTSDLKGMKRNEEEDSSGNSRKSNEAKSRREEDDGEDVSIKSKTLNEAKSETSKSRKVDEGGDNSSKSKKSSGAKARKEKEQEENDDEEAEEDYDEHEVKSGKSIKSNESKSRKQKGEDEDSEDHEDEDEDDDVKAAATPSTKKLKDEKPTKQQSARKLVVDEKAESTAYLQGFPYDVDVDKWVRLNCKQVKDVRVHIWHDTGRSRGCAHVDFANRLAMEKAVQDFNGVTVGLRYISICEANLKKEDASRGVAPSESEDGSMGRRRLFVGNLPYEVTEEQLRLGFAKFGRIKHVRLAQWNHTQNKKGFGYVEYEQKSFALDCVKSHREKPIMIQGRAVTLDYDQGKPKHGFKNESGRAWYKPDRENVKTFLSMKKKASNTKL